MSFFAVSVLFTSVASILVGAFAYFKGRANALNQSLALFSLALSIWLFSQWVGTITSQRDWLLIWMRIQVGAAVFLPVFYLYFIYALLELESKLAPRISLLIALIFTALDCTPLFINELVFIKGLKYFPKLTFVYAAFALWLSISFAYGLSRLISVLRRSA